MNLEYHDDHFDTDKGYIWCFIEKSAVLAISCFSPLARDGESKFSSITISYAMNDVHWKFQPSLSKEKKVRNFRRSSAYASIKGLKLNKMISCIFCYYFWPNATISAAKILLQTLQLTSATIVSSTTAVLYSFTGKVVVAGYVWSAQCWGHSS